MEIMEKENITLIRWEKIHWCADYDVNGIPYFSALCPKDKCHCRLQKSKEVYSIGEYKYSCVNCDFKITLNKSIEDKALDLQTITESQRYKDAEIVNLDGELVRVQREQKSDGDYWVDVKLSKNKKDEVQVMVLAGSRNSKNKTQLFLDIGKERLAFDQNNDHPAEVFAKVVCTFKNSESGINSKD